MERFLRTARAISSGESLVATANAVISAVVQVTEAEIGALVLIDDARGFTPLAWVGFPQSFLASGPVPSSLSKDVLDSATPVLLKHSPFGDFVPELRNLTSHVVAPVRAGGSLVGVLILGRSERAGQFEADDLMLAQLFAAQAARIVERDGLTVEVTSLRNGLTDLDAASRLLSPSSSVDALLEAIVDGGLRLSGATKGVVCIFDQASETINRVFHKGLDGVEIRRLFAVPEIRTVEAASEVVVLRGKDQTDLTVGGFSTVRGNRAVLVLLGSEFNQHRAAIMRAFLEHCRAALSAVNLVDELDRSGFQLTAIVNGMAKPIILVDALKRVALVNPRAEQVLGISAMFVIGAPIEGAFGLPQIEEILAGTGIVEKEILVGAPPRSFHVRVDDLEGGSAGRLLVMDDVTAEREASQRERDFVAMIGHEVRTPLAVLKGFAKLLLAKVKPGESISEQSVDWIQKIDSRTSQLEKLIEDILQISKIESRESALRLSEVHVRDLIQGVIDDALLAYEDRQVEIESDDELTWVLDEGKLRIVMRHLIGNALKYSDPPSAVTVNVQKQNDQLRIEVNDRGIGIVSNELPTIFERFRQVDTSATRAHGGTGIGLYLSAQLVKIHDGRIGVDSIWGKGSTFWVLLPKLEVPGESPAPDPARR